MDDSGDAPQAQPGNNNLMNKFSKLFPGNQNLSLIKEESKELLTDQTQIELQKK